VKRIDYELRGYGVEPTPTLVGIAGYRSADARAGYRLKKRATLALSGQNLLQTRRSDPQRPSSGTYWRR
jgi:hypothetical protein